VPGSVEHVSVCALRRCPDKLLVEHASVKLAAACCVLLVRCMLAHITTGSCSRAKMRLPHARHQARARSAAAEHFQGQAHRPPPPPASERVLVVTLRAALAGPVQRGFTLPQRFGGSTSAVRSAAASAARVAASWRGHVMPSSSHGFANHECRHSQRGAIGRCSTASSHDSPAVSQSGTSST